MRGVTNPPVNAPPFTSARPPDNSQQEMGEGSLTKEEGGGLWVGRPCWPKQTPHRGRKMQDSEKKNTPFPTQEPQEKNAASKTPLDTNIMQKKSTKSL